MVDYSFSGGHSSPKEASSAVGGAWPRNAYDSQTGAPIPVEVPNGKGTLKAKEPSTNGCYRGQCQKSIKKVIALYKDEIDNFNNSLGNE